MKCLRIGAWVALSSVLGGGVAVAQVTPGPATFAPGSVAQASRLAPVEREERRFIRDASGASRFELEASRLALARSVDPQVRSFATALVSYNTTAGNDLAYLLSRRGMAPPMLENSQRKTLNRLTRLSGARFNSTYLAEVGLADQRERIRSYEKAGLAAQDPAVRDWIERNLPALRRHVAAAETIATRTARTSRAGPVPVVAARGRTAAQRVE